MAILSYCIFFVNTFHLIDAQIQILASIYFRSYNKIFYHNNCYFSSKKAPKHFCPSAIKSHFYTLTSNPFLNMNLISSLDFTITSCTRLLQIPIASVEYVKICHDGIVQIIDRLLVNGDTDFFFDHDVSPSLFWCARWGSNPHGYSADGFWDRHVFHLPSHTHLLIRLFSSDNAARSCRL